MRQFFNRFAKKPPVVKNDFTVSDIRFYLGVYAKRGTEYASKKVTADNGDSAAYKVSHLVDDKTFSFQMTIVKDGKTYETAFEAQRADSDRLKVTSFIFDNRKEPLRTRKETYLALNFIANQIRSIELSGKVPQPHHPVAPPFNTLSRLLIRSGIRF